MTTMVYDDREDTAVQSSANVQQDVFKPLVSESLPAASTTALFPEQRLHQRTVSVDDSDPTTTASNSNSPVSVVIRYINHSRIAVAPKHHHDSNKQQTRWLERMQLPIAVAAWYLVGVVSIVTTKVLLSDWQIPPLVITFQQLTMGSCVLWSYLRLGQGGAQPWPWDAAAPSSSSLSSSITLSHAVVSKHTVLELAGPVTAVVAVQYTDFILAGLFNALDFLASNTAFSQSAASFVETIKASEPITTTVVALAWKVDRLGKSESASLALLIAGVLLSTVGNAEAAVSSSGDAADSQEQVLSDEEEQALQNSFRISATVMTANLCFAFRAMSQKFYRRKAAAAGTYQLDDVNLLCRMQQMGALSLLLPVLIFDGAAIVEVLLSEFNTLDLQIQYLGLALLNAVSYATYK
jgi:drug/metabolite transporter (DMT)-like permease